MNRREFGQLVATLRQDLGWTQFQLAEFADTDVAVISQIERGVKKHCEPELLFNLANVLQLTTLERREFFLAACGVDTHQLVRQPGKGTTTDTNHPVRILSRLIDIMAELSTPAFLNDLYGDVIALNRATIRFFSIPDEMIGTAAELPGGYNTMRMTFGRDLVGRLNVSDRWDEYAMTSMLSFRAATLRYRAKPYFQYLLKTFRDPVEYPLFDRYWKRVASVEEDHAMNTDRFEYWHEKHGLLKYMTAVIKTTTAYGELYLNAYMPLEEHAGEVFAQMIAEGGREIIRLAPWPEKRMV